jgi:hypothetical protein
MRNDATSKETKLFELRHKTDRGLVLLVRKEIGRGLTLAETAVTSKSKQYVQAERAYLMSGSWLLLTSGLDRDERRDLELRLQELKSALQRLRSQDLQQHVACASAV